MKQFAVDAAREVRLTSDMKIKVGSALVRGNRILGLSANKRGTSPVRSAWSRHAEVGATINRNAKGATVYVYREHGLTGEMLMAKTCLHCEEWLRYVGVRKVVYTTPNGLESARL